MIEMVIGVHDIYFKYCNGITDLKSMSYNKTFIFDNTIKSKINIVD